MGKDMAKSYTTGKPVVRNESHIQPESNVKRPGVFSFFRKKQTSSEIPATDMRLQGMKLY